MEALAGGKKAQSTQTEGEQEEEVKKEKTSFNVKMVEIDKAKKISIIKEIKNFLGLGLKESKEFVEGLPGMIKKDVSKEEAEELTKKFQEIGAKIELE